MSRYLKGHISVSFMRRKSSCSGKQCIRTRSYVYKYILEALPPNNCLLNAHETSQERREASVKSHLSQYHIIELVGG